jgi:adenylate cyclase
MKKLGKLLLNPWCALITLGLLLSLRITDTPFVESVRLRYFDTLITTKAPIENNVYTVDIDDAALEKLGQWPLPRGEYAQIIHDIYQRNAGLVVLNVLMPEPDRMREDSELAAVMKRYPVLLVSSLGEKNRNTPRETGAAILNSEYQNQILSYPGITSNIMFLEKSAVGVGTINTLPEIDGVVRRIPLLARVGDTLYPSLSMEVIRVAAGDENFQVKLFPGGVEKMRIPAFGPIVTDQLSRVWIDWSQQHQKVSVTQLPKDFGGAIVIVGATAAGIANPVPTAAGAVWPHHVQASVIGTLANGVNIQRPDYADGVEILAAALAGVLLLLLSRWVYVGLATMLTLIAAGIWGSRYLFDQYLWLFDSTFFVVAVVLVGLHCYGVKFVYEFLQKMQIKKQFGGYVSPVIVERLQKNPELIKLGGENRELSIIMTDMRNFTALGESYGDRVEEFTATMNRYMTAIADPIMKNQGCLIKFIGDASLHVHGAPLDDHKHAVSAVKTALDMLKAVEQFNQELIAEGRPPVGMGVGVNTGVTLIGNIGAKTRFGYDVLGDSVSLAARLEGQSKPYGVKIVIGPTTAEQAKDEFFLIKLDNIAVKGKKVGVDIYTVVDELNTAPKDYWTAREEHNRMLEYYCQQKWASATAKIAALRGCFDGQLDHYYDMMLNRITELEQANLPPDWDCVYRASSK